MENWSQRISQLNHCLESLEVRDVNGRVIVPEAGFYLWAESTRMVRAIGNTIYLIGNGQCASISGHTAALLTNKAHVHAEVFSDLSVVTAVAKKVGYDYVFAELISGRMKPGDMLAVVSFSGESENLLAAAHTALRLGGQVVTLTAQEMSNSLSELGAINFYVPTHSQSLAEACHTSILHHWMERISDNMGYSLFEQCTPPESHSPNFKFS